MKPVVSVVCLCFNHERFVRQALQSVIDQTYHPIQLIVVDDQSSDHSVEVIKKFLLLHPSVTFVALPGNLGNCRAFNAGLRHATGDYVIDLAADDVLLPDRVARGVQLLEEKKDYGVQFSDAEIIDEHDAVQGRHSDRFPHDTIPSGDIFVKVLSRYFINSPTMMMRKSVFDALGGYDESLAYEDFDFWVRSSRQFKYIYTPEVLIRRRALSTSMGRRQYEPGSSQLKSTLMVCEKALALCRSESEYRALKKRIMIEARLAIKNGALKISLGYWRLWRKAIVNG